MEREMGILREKPRKQMQDMKYSNRIEGCPWLTVPALAEEESPTLQTMT